jgi:hypothetical protein
MKDILIIFLFLYSVFTTYHLLWALHIVHKRRPQ